jgi:acyl carrier protein
MTDERAEVLDKLTTYARTVLPSAQDGGELGPATPLLTSGLLNSLETARLLSYVEREFGVRIPPGGLVRRNFENLQTITDLVTSLRKPAS